MPAPHLPDGVLDLAGRGPDRAEWVARLPALTQDLVEAWSLRLDGPARHRRGALVLPVRTSAGGPATLKIAFPVEESEHEHLALRHWDGRGAVRLLRADPRRRALLLERLPADQDLNDLWDLEACEVVAGLYPLLHVPAPPQLRLLSSYVERRSAALARLPRDAALPRRLVEQALSLARDLVADPASIGTMVHGDLYYDTVLATGRGAAGGWRAIDPEPLSGDPHYEPAPMLAHRFAELDGPGGVRAGVRRRFHTIVDAAGLEEDRARDWVVVRMLHRALRTIQDDPAGRDPATAERLTVCVTVAKAVQD